MGYLVTSHIVKGNADLNLLNTLPSEIAFKAYQIDNFDSIFIDFFSSRIENDYPFQRLLPSTGLPLELPQPYNVLNTLYNKLRSCGAANSFKRALVNLNLQISDIFKGDVLSFVSDDDELDFSIHSKAGAIIKLRFIADDTEIIYENGELHIYPLLTEEGESLIDLSIFDNSPFTVHNRDREFSNRLHNIASSEVKSFLNTKENVLGLCYFDPPEYEMKEVK